MKRIVAVIAWVIASLLLCSILGNLLLFLNDYLNRNGTPLPLGVANTLGMVPAIGLFVLLPLTALLAIRGKLPWTGDAKQPNGAGSSRLRS